MHSPGSKATASKSRAGADCSQQRRPSTLNFLMRHQARAERDRGVTPLGNKLNRSALQTRPGQSHAHCDRVLPRPKTPSGRSRGLSFFVSIFGCVKPRMDMVWSACPALPLLQSPADGVSSFRTRNRDSAAIQAKLDQLIRATPSHPSPVGLEARAGENEKDESRSETCSTKPSVTPLLTAFERLLAARVQRGREHSSIAIVFAVEG